jgi:hypothetical protein
MCLADLLGAGRELLQAGTVVGGGDRNADARVHAALLEAIGRAHITAPGAQG